MNINIDTLPYALRPLCRSDWQDVTFGFSGIDVYRITSAFDAPRYLKVTKPSLGHELLAEKERLQWLYPRLPVPTVLAFATDDNATYLLLSEIKGMMSYDAVFMQSIPQVVQLLAQGLKMFHTVDIGDCPFDESLQGKIALARERVQRGLVDENDFNEQHQGMHADELFVQLLVQRPKHEDVVFTHGDYCLPNILIDPEHMNLSGFIDLGRAGVADRYKDLALAARSLTFNFGAEWVPLLFELYGIYEVDEAKIQFYQLLDEFF